MTKYINIETLKEFIENNPEEKVSPIVYCKDCKYLQIKDFAYGYCDYTIGVLSPWDFCSRGRSKTPCPNAYTEISKRCNNYPCSSCINN